MSPEEPLVVNLAASAFPSEVTCKICRNLMLPDDLEGQSWTCYVCDRRVVVRLVSGGR